MRLLIPMLCLVTGVCAAASYRDVAQAVNDDQKLVFAGVDPAEALIRRRCGAAVLETDDAPSSFDCVYVQTEKHLNLFSLEDGYLMPELQARMNTNDGIALQRTGRWSQIQVFSNGRVAAFYTYGDNWIDNEQTEAVYRWLLDRGVSKRSPRKWIGR
jgi:hypothetical protein